MKEDSKICSEILQKLKKHAKATPFLEPVDYVSLNLLDYPEKIKQPMDFQTITGKLKNYKTKKEFFDDVQLIFNNCYTYNGETSHISRMAKDLEIYFNQITTKYTQNNLDLDLCTNILNELFKSKWKKYTWPFVEPVNLKEVTNYLSIIEKPMDLSTVKKKLPHYLNKFEFFADLMLILKNCFKFNPPESEIYICGKELEKIIDKNCNFLSEKDLLSEISLLNEKLQYLSDMMRTYEKLLFYIRRNEGKQKIFTLEERIIIAESINRLDEEKCAKIAMIIKKNDNHFIIHGKEEIEIDFKVMPDFIIQEIEEYLKKENILANTEL
ncbi:Transcription initiation factor TFIID, subunit BDF1 [Pseudoloma neurophilia]|uniref:Transcription initiation factor TFIID, subunit BDF1 n=1 Tax=Pseudoloma neurophilia TaxID=146866 RepID=A0A0R0M2A7_9MICR|nr:Transcription initiation factor TFIID, subunit BDF1 [Pseudoloma neurophilia]